MSSSGSDEAAPARAPVTSGRPQVRPLHPGDDLEAELDLRERAFGPMGSGGRDGWLTSLRTAISEGRLLGAFDGPRLIGTARFLDMRQWWHGRPVPMAGVAGVKVAPEHRGGGVGRALMAARAGRGRPPRLPDLGAVPGDRVGLPVAGLGAGGRAVPDRAARPVATAPDRP